MRKIFFAIFGLFFLQNIFSAPCFDGADFRFTSKDGCLYAFCMKPDSEKFCIRSLKDAEINSVEVLGDYSVVNYECDENGLNIVINKAPASDKPICFKIL